MLLGCRTPCLLDKVVAPYYDFELFEIFLHLEFVKLLLNLFDRSLLKAKHASFGERDAPVLPLQDLLVNDFTCGGVLTDLLKKNLFTHSPAQVQHLSQLLPLISLNQAQFSKQDEKDLRCVVISVKKPLALLQLYDRGVIEEDFDRFD